MKLKTIYLLVFGLLSFSGILAQTITGTVTDSSGNPVPGVNVIEKGTSNGTSTDFDGKYSIDVSNANAILEFSALGFVTAERAASSGSVINVTMEESTEELNAVVVTALGIKKEQKALGYSLTEVSGEAVAEVPQVNAINALQGKIAGVNITGAATGPAGTSKVVIRGVSSLSGTSQPLYIVDGIPINNQNLGSASRWGGSDFGDGISGVNPDDIESISVLKGGAAAALYGSRASAGVIVITTKSGKGQKGLGIDISSSYQLETVMTDLYEFQTAYGQGINGVAPATQQEALDAGMQSWGARLGSVSSAVQFDGVSRPYTYTGDNIDKYYETGTTAINTVAISQAGENYNLRFSATDLSNDDITPNAGLNRKTFSLNAGAVLADKLTLNVSGKYIIEEVNNRPRTSDSPGNGNFTVALSPPNIDINNYKPGFNEDGTEFLISSNQYHQNPYWTAYRFSNESDKNRFIGSTTLKYQFTDELYLLGRTGIDQFTARITSVEPYGTAYKPRGGMQEQTFNVKTVDADVILGFDKQITDDIATSTLVGANSNYVKNEFINLIGNDFVIPSLVNIENVANRNYNYQLSRVKRNGVYFSSEFSFRNYLYVTVTGRNDWFSTLSKEGKTAPNNYFYPSVNSSFVFSDAFEMPEWISFGKLRAGYSDVGGGANDPYQLALTYAITDTYTATGPTVSLGSINNSSLPNENLEPFSKKEYEIGLDLRLFKSRLNLDLTYYSNKTENDIVNINTSTASGYSSASINIGELQNRGVEVLLSGSPVKNTDFEWNVSYNLTYNKNEVTKTDNDGNPIFPGDAAYGVNSQSGFLVGYPAATIYGTTFVRDDAGNIQYESNGAPTIGPNAVIGQGVAPWTMGITNTFNYKNFEFSFLIDGKFGGDIFSGTSAFANFYGASNNTLVGRENGLTVTGVNAAGNDFSTTISPENLSTYYQRLYDIAEANVQDADFIKLRQLSLGYSLPTSLLENTFIRSARVSFIGRNLFFLMRNTENIDPESAYNNTFANGIERFGLPSTRSYGLSVDVKF